MSAENPLTEDRSASQRARQKSSVILACSLLFLVGLALLVLPLDKIPYPVRIGMAATDFVAASTLWLIARQKFKDQ
jgi:Na+/H+ antiporter NhaD/arsenite permease-like protein